MSALPENALNLSRVPHDLPGNVVDNRRRFLEVLNVRNSSLATVCRTHSDRLMALICRM